MIALLRPLLLYFYSSAADAWPCLADKRKWGLPRRHSRTSTIVIMLILLSPWDAQCHNGRATRAVIEPR